jgi:hypothetical protein
VVCARSRQLRACFSARLRCMITSECTSMTWRLAVPLLYPCASVLPLPPCPPLPHSTSVLHYVRVFLRHLGGSWPGSSGPHRGCVLHRPVSCLPSVPGAALSPRCSAPLSCSCGCAVIVCVTLAHLLRQPAYDQHLSLALLCCPHAWIRVACVCVCMCVCVCVYPMFFRVLALVCASLTDH